MTDSPLSACVDRFLRYLGVERQLSPITLTNYQRQLDALIALADEAGLKSWQQCDAAQVRSFAVRSRRAGLGPASLALRLSALRSFFDWMVSQGELAANPAKISWSTFRPQRSTALTMFFAISLWQVIRCTFACIRTPDSPTGFLIPSW